MLGLFATLNLGARAMAAQQTAVEVTGQNLANVNNPAYARQRVNFQTSPTATTDPKVGPQGTGVEVASIQQLRDVLLDAQITGETSVSNYWNKQQSALQNTETQLGEFLGSTVSGTSSVTGGNNSLSAQLAALFTAFQDVAANPASLSQRQALINQAQTLASSLNQAAQRLTSADTQLNQSVTNDVTSANLTLSDIANLNGQIIQAEATGGVANDLRDMRQQKLEDLAKLVNIDTSTAANGTVNVSVGGTQLVSGQQVLDTLQSYDSGAGRMLVRTTTGGATLTLTGGSIAGAMDARDGELKTLRTGLDTLSSTLIGQVNSIHTNGRSLPDSSGATSTGASFFSGSDAATISVTPSIANNPALFQAAAATALNSPGDNTTAVALGQLGQAGLTALNGQTFDQNYAGLVAALGNAVSSANDQVSSNTAVSKMMLKQRDSVSGVSLDEEMTNMISFQKAYTASAHIVTTVDQMLQTVLDMKQ